MSIENHVVLCLCVVFLAEGLSLGVPAALPWAFSVYTMLGALTWISIARGREDVGQPVFGPWGLFALGVAQVAGAALLGLRAGGVL